MVGTKLPTSRTLVIVALRVGRFPFLPSTSTHKARAVVGRGQDGRGRDSL